MVGYNEFSTIQALENEFSLGKDLLEKAISNIDQDSIERLKNYNEATDGELSTANVFFKMLAMLNNSDGLNASNWRELSGFNEATLTQISNVSTQIEEINFKKEKVDTLRKEFKMKNDENEDIKNLKEFLCETFCLIEIVQELHELKEKVENDQSNNQIVILLI